MTITNQVLYDPTAPLPNADDSNQLVILPGKKRKLQDEGPLPKKKSATGGKKGKNFVKEREKQKITKKENTVGCNPTAKVEQINAVCDTTPSSSSAPLETSTVDDAEVKVETGATEKENTASVVEDYSSSAQPSLSSGTEKPVTCSTATNGVVPVSAQEIKTEADDDVTHQPRPASIQRQRVLVARDTEIERKRSQLPIYSEEVPIMETINDNIVTVICGETGSGKTTQIPQFLYEAGYASNSQLIGITEPRRVAAISMAQRVGEELGSPDAVSYQIRYEGNRTPQTKILFMTDGVLMKEMESDVMLKKYSAILIDEAHERSMYSDVLIGMLSRIAPLRAKTSNPLKLIIMSATLRLADFIHKRLFPVLEPKVINVESRQFPVTVHFEKRTPDDYMMATFRKIQYDSSKDGHVYVKGSKKWKKKQLEEAQNLKLEDFGEDRTHSFDGEDLHETGACDTLWDDYDAEDDSQEDALNIPMPAPPATCVPLYCLPLYSLLSSEKQRRVFEPPPEGTRFCLFVPIVVYWCFYITSCRMCVIATNVAETSLTIPGVKYVVDCGFEKRRLYDSVTGVSKFVVDRISQASADQRAGRAGRIAAGHAYRLYSSAVFQTFEKFSRPEILDKPADQLVLHLKSMNIVKVINFPFPSPPDSETLEVAEERLIKLGALAKTTKDGKTEARITPLGRTLSVFPLAPAYAKVIAMANQHDLMPYAILLISALSVREPLVPVSSIRGQTDEETKEKMTAVLKLRRGWCGKGPGRRLGDLLVLMRAVICYEEEKMNPSACTNLGLRHKAMVEIRRLRVQLTNIVNTSFKSSADIVMDPHLPPPSDAQAQMLRYVKSFGRDGGCYSQRFRQMMVAGLADRIARRVDRSADNEEVPKGAYQTMKLQEFVFIDPCSVMYTDEPDYVIYQEIVQPHVADFRYEADRDEIVKSVGVTFGPLEWRLDPIERPIPNDIMLYRYFAQFLLAGQVMPLLAQFVTKMLAPPTTMVRSWAKLQKRTEGLLNALVLKEVHSKAALVEEFKKNENYLLEEYLDWLPESLHDSRDIVKWSKRFGTVENGGFFTDVFTHKMALPIRPSLAQKWDIMEKGFACQNVIKKHSLLDHRVSFELRQICMELGKCAGDLEKDARRLMDEFYASDGPIKFRTAHLIDEWFCASLALCQEGFALVDALSQAGLSKEMSKCVEGIPAFVEQVAQLFPTEAIFDVAMMLTDYPLKRLLRLRAQLYQSAIDFYHIVLVREAEDEKITMLQSALHSERFIFLLNEKENLSELLKGCQKEFRDHMERALESACESQRGIIVEELARSGLLKGLGNLNRLNSSAKQAVEDVSQIFPHFSTQYIHVSF
ncbi:helicase protein, partial [Ostertagia ostertagi]